MDRPGEITRLLRELSDGGEEALNRLSPLVYDELRAIAHRRLRSEPAGHTLNTTGLVHEAWVRLAAQNRVDWQNRAHFFAVAARAMRRILIDYANARNAAKRGGGRREVPLDEAAALADRRSDELIALDVALRRLERLDGRQARVVECRFFGEMSIEETAEALGVSPATVKRDWTVARAWLHRELSA